MNIFNRIVVVLLLLFISVTCIVSIVNLFLNLYVFSDVVDRFVNFIQSINPVILALVLFFILAISLLLLVLEFYRRKVRVASINIEQSGRTLITLKTASNKIREKIMGVESAVNPKVTILPKDSGIIINIFSQLAKSDHVAQKSQEIRQLASDFATNELGFKVMQTNFTATGFTERKETPPKEKPAKEKQSEAQETQETAESEESPKEDRDW